ncbi:hypothetical protein [Puia dinghuensis]|uniref:DUF5007 domain-containing protein n=1 Tax=Puia dinghuensis TaxID=1792502 RepID=A0A8J2UIF4_9BACT|nr:hypothetical protein [Puia dinghuensis]GGB20587.1 hypothetical protein GCM10011511_50410 [Puia dinghuensis]
MRRQKPIIRLLLSAAVVIAAVTGCEKIVHGYLSPRVFYQVNPFYVQQGVTTVSGSLITSGSTEPLHVKVLALKDSTGKDAYSLLTTPKTITTYTAAITFQDSTLALLQQKLKDSLVSPFNIASIGGRLQFTAATAFVPAGTYNMDIEVTNPRGTETLNNACQIIIQPLSTTYSLAYQRQRYYDSTGALLQEYVGGNNTDVQYTPGDSLKVVFKFVDANNAPFDPLKGQVTAWSTALPNMRNWDPYYAPVLTDSTIAYTIPNAGKAFPYFSTCKDDNGSTFNGNGNAPVYYRIMNTADQANQYIQVLNVMQYLTTGNYLITIHLNNAVRK